jgi:hypothetical protein
MKLFFSETIIDFTEVCYFFPRNYSMIIYCALLGRGGGGVYA